MPLRIARWAGALALAFATPAVADECASFDTVVARMTAAGATIDRISADRLAAEVAEADRISGDAHVNVTRAFEISGPGGKAIGLEIAGCLLDPIWIWKRQQGGPGRMRGRGVGLVAGLVAGALIVVFALFWLGVDAGMAAEGCRPPQVLVSWYGRETCHGRPPGRARGTCHTATGLPFDGTQMIVAHKTLPFGARVRFTLHGRSITVPVADRGPYVAGRSFDLSHAAARALGLAGVACVTAELAD